MILIDNSISPAVARAICRIRDDVRSGADIYPIFTKDTTWLLEAGTNGWLVILRDKKVTTRPAERRAIMDHAVGAFLVGQKRNPTRWDYFRIIVSKLEEMEELFRNTQRPFVFKIDGHLAFKQIVYPHAESGRVALHAPASSPAPGP